jgi:hypothetical protein
MVSFYFSLDSLSTFRNGTAADHLTNTDPAAPTASGQGTTTTAPPSQQLIDGSRPNLTQYEDIYRDLHQQLELSGQEKKTAERVSKHLSELGYDVKDHIGGTGVVGILRNGNGPVVLLRSELDALPVKEETGLSYASHVHQVDDDGVRKPVMHACGHDMHIASLLAAANLLKNAKKSWTGTLLCLFQPNEERSGGAQAMIDDGLYDKIPVPDICLAQHVVPLKTGITAIRPGPSWLPLIPSKFVSTDVEVTPPSHKFALILCSWRVLSSFVCKVSFQESYPQPRQL